MRQSISIGLIMIAFFATFLAGWSFHAVTANSAKETYGKDGVNDAFQSPSAIAGSEASTDNTARFGPTDRISESQIRVYKKGILLNIENATWSRFTDTHSMDPVINKNSNGIELAPKSSDDVNVGDIISYRSNYADGLIIHRVIEKKTDDKGTYFVVKGDNLKNPDPGKIRLEQIHGVLVGIIY